MERWREYPGHRTAKNAFFFAYLSLSFQKMQVDCQNVQDDVSLDYATLPDIVQSVLELEQQTCDEVAIHFVNEATICQLHQEHFGDPSPTDCISFPMDSEDEPYRVLGEVFVCPKAALDYIRLHGGDLSEEITLYVVHGLLHLLGYDDQAQEDLVQMRQAEQRHMARLRLQQKMLSAH